MDRLVIRLKAIKYKKEFFCYLSFYPDLGFLSHFPLDPIF